MNRKDFEEIVNTFETRNDSQGQNLNMHSLLVSIDDNVFLHRFNKQNELADIRSISKTILAMVTGIVRDLSQKGYYPPFDENSYIYPILKDKINISNETNLKYLKKIKVKHLLTHTMGYDKVLLMRGDIADMDPFTYLDYIMNQPIVYEPGDHYLYSNAGLYTLSALLEEFIQEDLLEFIDRHLFSKLNIENFHWEKYGNYLAGATKLWLSAESLLKVGKLLMNYGRYNNQEIIKNDWVEKITQPTSIIKDNKSPNTHFKKHAYGMGIWLGENDIFFGSGTDGQSLVVIPEKNSIIVTLAEQKDVEPLESIIDYIVKEIIN